MYKPKEFAQKIGVSVSTLRRWDKEKCLYHLEQKQVKQMVKEQP